MTREKLRATAQKLAAPVARAIAKTTAWVKIGANWCLRAPHGQLATIIVPLTLVLAFTPFGPYLESNLFRRPALNLRRFVGLAPALDPALRVITVADASLERLGRQLSFADWQTIAGRLFDAGVERVLLLGFHRLQNEVGGLAARPKSGKLIIGGVVIPRADAARVVGTESVPRELWIQAAGNEPPQAQVGRLMTSAAPVLELVDGIGALNMSPDVQDAMPAAFGVDATTALPSIGLRIANDLRWEDGALRIAGKAVPTSVDGLIHIDFLPPEALKGLPIAAMHFFDDQGAVAVPFSKALTEKIKGARFAIFVPEAFTGTRFVESPFGMVPSYYAPISVANSTLGKGHFVVPILPWLGVLIMSALSVLACTLPSAGRTRQLAMGLPWVTTALGLVALFVGHWLLPIASAVSIQIAVLVVTSVQAFVKTWSDKVRLLGDLELGKTVQNLALPPNRSGVVGTDWEFEVHFAPYGTMSGDWYQTYFAHPVAGENSAVLAIGDVVGKGPSAALNTAVIACVWNLAVERWAAHGIALEELFLSLHAAIWKTFRGQQNSTIAAARVQGHEAYVAVAACAAWRKISAQGEVSVLSAAGSNPLGGEETRRAVPVQKVTVEPGDMLVAFTDGVLESGLSHRRFAKAMRAAGPLPNGPSAFRRVIEAAIKAGENEVQPDDVTILMLRRRPEDVAHAG